VAAAEHEGGAGGAAIAEAPRPSSGTGSGQSLGTRTIRSMLWAYGSYVGGRVVVLASVAILARVLAPRDFGLVALALTFTALLETIKDFGLGQALIVSKEEDLEARANTVFWWGMIIGTAGCLVIVAIAPLIADFYGEPAVLPLLAVLALNFPLRAAGATHEALIQQRMNFRGQTLAQIASVVVRGGAGIVLALMGFGAWSLVVGYLLGTFVWTVALWILVRWRPRLRFTNHHARELFTFGGILTGVDVLHGIWASLDVLVIGRVLGATALGLYTIGARLPQLLIVNLSVVAASVLFPAFTKVDPGRLKDVFLTSLRFTLIVGAPIAVGLAALAEPIIVALFGDQWRGAVGAMQMLAIYALLLTIEIPGGTIFKVTGRASVLLKLAVPRTILLLVALLLFAENGLVAVAGCIVAVSALFALLAIVIAARATGTGLGAIVGTSWAPVVAALGAGAAILGVTLVVDGDWPTIIAGTAVGAVVYVALMWVVARDSLVYVLGKALPRFARA
jgi:O-antigen/teichoic acid export membrane protein